MRVFMKNVLSFLVGLGGYFWVYLLHLLLQLSLA